MSSNSVFQIHPNVHRSLYRYSIKNFIEDQLGDEFSEFSKESGIDLTDNLGYSRLLDECIDVEKIGVQEVLGFLRDQITYGRQRNMYVYMLMNSEFLNDEQKVIEKVNRLNIDGSESVHKLPFINSLHDGIDRGATKLVYVDIIKEDENISSIRIVIGRGILVDGKDCNNYISIEINLSLNLLIVKLKNWKDENEDDYSLDTLADEFKQLIKNSFNLTIPLSSSTVQKLLKNMAEDLTQKVLDPVMESVNAKIEDPVKEKIAEWIRLVSDKDFTEADINIVEKSVLNNFYRIYVQHEIGKLTNEQLLEKFNVAGYPRYVKFTDDTIGEARAKSPDPRDSLLDTSVYYDLKARLDSSEKIKVITVYWIDFPHEKRFGTSFKAESQERFKINIMPNFFTKEMNDYVLQKITMYKGS